MSTEAEEVNIVTRRREIRKRKILENAELRKQKIFGLNSPSVAASMLTTDGGCSNANDHFPLHKPSIGNKDDPECEDTISSSSFIPEEIRLADTSLDSSYDFSNFGEYMRNIPDPLADSDDEDSQVHRTFKQRDANSFLPPDSDESNLSFENGIAPNISLNKSHDVLETRYMNSNSSSRSSSLLFSPNERKSVEGCSTSLILIIINHPAAPCLLALIVSILLFFNMGNVVSHSLFVPFFIWEIQLIIASYGTFESNQARYNLIETAFLLCGIRKNIITKYIWIITLTKNLLEDFALYITTVIIWNIIFGYPEVTVNAE